MLAKLRYNACFPPKAACTMNSKLNQVIQTESYGEVQEVLQFLLEECSLDDAPSVAEVQQWQQVLQQRGSKFAKLAQLCQQFIDESA